MTGGIGRIRAEQFWTEQVRLTPLTSDPADSEEGELWLRADLAEEDDQLATLRLDSGGSTVDIPVFDVGADVPDDVSTQLRLVVGGQQGFVPTVEDGGSIPQFGVWSDGVRHEAIKELIVIPDSVVLDDWADDPDITSNQFTDRRSFDELNYQGPDPTDRFNPVGSRPEWEIESGSSDISISGDDTLVLDGESPEFWSPSELPDTDLVWEIGVEDLRNNSTGLPIFVLMGEKGNADSGSIAINLREGDPARLEKYDGSHESWIDIGSGALDDGGVVRIERRGTEWEAFLDGESKGTTDESFVPNELYTGYDQRDTDQTTEIDFLEVYPLEDD